MISYYTQIKNRLYQLAQTFDYNASIAKKNNSEWIIVDHYSSDGLADFIRSRIINKDHIKFFQCLSNISYSIPIFKNFAARLSGGEYLFNLDADNFINSEPIDTQFGSCCFSHHSSPDRQIKYLGTGCCGRIGCSRYVFEKLGGYCESFLPASAHDSDFVKRCDLINYEFKEHDVEIMPIPNDKYDTIRYISNPEHFSWNEMKIINESIMQYHIDNKVVKGNTYFATGEFLLNFKHKVKLTKDMWLNV